MPSYDKKKGVNMKKEQKDIEKDIYDTYDAERKELASFARHDENMAKISRQIDRGTERQKEDISGRMQVRRDTLKHMEDVGERQRKMGAVLRQRKQNKK